MVQESPAPPLSTSSVVLSEERIRQRLSKGDLRIEPLVDIDTQLGGCKMDLRLSGIYYEIKQSSVKTYDPLYPPSQDYRRKIVMPLGVPYILHPGMLALTPTFESIVMPDDLLGILQGRSSLGRLGIIVHATAGFVDPTYKGPITLELSNLGHLPVALYSLTRVAAIAFVTVTGKVKKYGEPMASPVHPEKEIISGHFNSQLSEPSKLNEDWETEIFRALKEKKEKVIVS